MSVARNIGGRWIFIRVNSLGADPVIFCFLKIRGMYCKPINTAQDIFNWPIRRALKFFHSQKQARVASHISLPFLQLQMAVANLAKTYFVV